MRVAVAERRDELARGGVAVEDREGPALRVLPAGEAEQDPAAGAVGRPAREQNRDGAPVVAHGRPRKRDEPVAVRPARAGVVERGDPVLAVVAAADVPGEEEGEAVLKGRGVVPVERAVPEREDEPAAFGAIEEVTRERPWEELDPVAVRLPAVDPEREEDVVRAVLVRVGAAPEEREDVEVAGAPEEGEGDPFVRFGIDRDEPAEPVVFVPGFVLAVAVHREERTDREAVVGELADRPEDRERGRAVVGERPEVHAVLDGPLARPVLARVEGRALHRRRAAAGGEDGEEEEKGESFHGLDGDARRATRKGRGEAFRRTDSAAPAFGPDAAAGSDAAGAYDNSVCLST